MGNQKRLIRELDFKSNHERRKIIAARLTDMNIKFYEQRYSTGTNLIVDLGKGEQRIGVGSHFDRVHNSGGANDNGSAIAVCFDIIEKFKELDIQDLGIRLFFFDEEETGLKGSSAYVSEHGVKDLIGLINMELVGMGDKFAIWPTNAHTNGAILGAFEAIVRQKRVFAKRFDQIVTNTADHVPFRKAGLTDSFTVTCISDRDVAVANDYYDALFRGAENDHLFEILSKAPIFAHYHRPTDIAEHVNEESIEMTSSAIWETIVAIQKPATG